MSWPRRKSGGGATPWEEVEFSSDRPASQTWTQMLQRPGKHAFVCLDGFLSMNFSEEDEMYHRRCSGKVSAVDLLNAFVVDTLIRSEKDRQHSPSDYYINLVYNKEFCQIGCLLVR